MSDDKTAAQPDPEAPRNNKTPDPNDASANGVDPDLEFADAISDVIGADLGDVDPGNDTANPQGEPQDELASMQAQLEQAMAKADENMDLALRTQAEMENLRKRQSRELENAHKFALKGIAEELLPVKDTLELGVAAAGEESAELSKIVEGTELTLKMLTQALGKFNITEVDPQGDKFNPDLHQAISMQEGTDQPADTVLTVMQKGYTLNERLLRPAMVVIAK